MWTDSSVEAFKYALDVDKEQQMPRLFVQLRANFQPSENRFMVVKQIGDATDSAPKHFKR